MTQLKTLICAVAFFASATVVSSIDFDRDNAISYVQLISRQIGARTVTASRHFIETNKLLNSSLSHIIEELERNITSHMESVKLRMDTIIASKNLQESTCKKYLDDLKQKAETSVATAEDRIRCTLHTTLERLTDVMLAVDEAEKTMVNLKTQAESCRGQQCWSIRTKAEHTKSEFFSVSNNLLCRDKKPSELIPVFMRKESNFFKEWAQEALRDVEACAHQAHQ